MPLVSSAALEKLSKKSPQLEHLYNKISNAITAIPPYGLGFPSDTAQSAYYPGDSIITRNEISAVSRLLEEHSIFPENTRIQKISGSKENTFEVLRASVEH